MRKNVNLTTGQPVITAPSYAGEAASGYIAAAKAAGVIK